MVTLTVNRRQRLEEINRLLTAPPEESNLNHYDRQRLEDEYEELLHQEAAKCFQSTKRN